MSILGLFGRRKYAGLIGKERASFGVVMNKENSGFYGVQVLYVQCPWTLPQEEEEEEEEEEEKERNKRKKANVLLCSKS